MFTNCSNLNQSKFKKKYNVKEFVISKYGEPSKVETIKNRLKRGLTVRPEEYEIWSYHYSSQIKNNRKVVFDNLGKIISNQKELKLIPFIMTNLLGYIAVILTGFGLIAIMFGHI